MPPGPEPPLAPDELVCAGGEREVLESFLDLYRGIVARKVSGLTSDQARRRLVDRAAPLLLIMGGNRFPQSW